MFPVSCRTRYTCMQRARRLSPCCRELVLLAQHLAKDAFTAGSSLHRSAHAGIVAKLAAQPRHSAPGELDTPRRQSSHPKWQRPRGLEQVLAKAPRLQRSLVHSACWTQQPGAPEAVVAALIAFDHAHRLIERSETSREHSSCTVASAAAWLA